MPGPTPPKNTNNGFNWGRFSKTLSFWILIILIPVALIQISGSRAESSPEISYTQYKQELDRDNIAEVTMSGGKNVTGSFPEPAAIAGQTAARVPVQFPRANSQPPLDQLAAQKV